MSALIHDPPVLSPLVAAFSSVQPELEALPEAEVLGINIDLPHAVTTVLGALPKIAAHRDAIARALPEVDLAQLDKLQTYARAAAHAHAVVMAASTVPPMRELAARASRLRQLLCSDASALANRGLLDRRCLNGLKGPNGYQNLAFDLLVLAALFREHWAQVCTKTALDASELDAAEALAEQLIDGINARKRPAPQRAAAIEQRRRAFTLLANAYDEARCAISYLRWKQGDIESIAPSLYRGRSGNRWSKREQLTPDDGDADMPPPTAA